MDLRLHPRYPPLAQRVAVLLSYLQSADPKGTLDAAVASDTLQSIRSIYQPATADTPSWYAASSGGVSLLLIGGCTLLTHAADTMSGYSGSLLSALVDPVNDYFTERGNAIMADCAANNFLTDVTTVLAGHSLGGAIAEYILGTRPDRGLAQGSHLITFGAPRYGNEQQARINDVDYRARYMNSDDPVPLLPPSLADTLGIALAFSVRELIRFGGFVHSSGGVQLTPSAVLSQATLPSDAAMNGTASIVGWYLALDGSSSSAHHITAYAARLALYISQHPPITPAPVAGGSQERLGTDNRRHFTQAQQRMATAVNQLEARQNAVPVAIPQVQLFTTRRVGRTFLVEFGDTTIAISGTRRAAHHLARAGNDFIRTMQHQPLVEPDALVSQLTDYLALAADPDSGFRPTLNTRAPE